MADILEILKEREKTHGEFKDFAILENNLIHTLLRFNPEKKLSDTQSTVIRMICHKLTRIITGDANHQDHWVDIAGYATLESRELQRKAIESMVGKPVKPV